MKFCVHEYKNHEIPASYSLCIQISLTRSLMGIPDTGTEEVAKRPKGPIRHPRRIDAIQVLSYGLRIFVCRD